jgi:hypothetical protein
MITSKCAAVAEEAARQQAGGKESCSYVFATINGMMILGDAYFLAMGTSRMKNNYRISLCGPA